MTNLIDRDNYGILTTIDGAIELVACWDISDSVAPFDTYFGGVKGCLQKLTIQRIFPGMYKLQWHDVWSIDPYPAGTPQPVRVDATNPYVPNTMTVQHVQVCLSNWQVTAAFNTALNHYAQVWWWNPDEFPVEMAPADPSIKNSIIVSIFNTLTGAREDVLGMRGNICITLKDTTEPVRLIAKGGF